MIPLLDRLNADRDALRAQADTILSKYDTDEVEDSTNLSDADETNLTQLRAEQTKFDERIKELVTDETNRVTADRLQQQLLDARRGVPSVEHGGQSRQGATSLGEQFVESSEFLEYRSNPQGNGKPMASTFALIKSVDANSKALAGSVATPDAAMPARRFPLLEVVGKLSVDRANFHWIEYPLAPPEAGDVLEGAAKPEASIVPVLKEGVLGKWAHTIPVTQEALEDVSGLRSRIDTDMIDGVRLKASKAVATAITGATLPKAEHADGLLQAIRVGWATVEDKDFIPNTVLLNPADYAEIDIELMTRTLLGASNQTTPWGLRYVSSSLVTAGKAYVGDFQTGVKLFTRSGIQLAMTDSHADEFVDNIYRIRAEQRGIVKIERPEALVEVSKTAAP